MRIMCPICKGYKSFVMHNKNQNPLYLENVICMNDAFGYIITVRLKINTIHVI